MTDITLTPAPVAPIEASPPPPSRATFDVLPLSREVRETLAEIGYTHPTPVQIAVWEPATRGKDAVVQARTGTGKTAAFGLPIVDHLVRRAVPHVQVLGLCPTRELAIQVATEIERLGKRKNIKVTAIYGGAPMQRQIDAIADGAQVIIGTPGRVLDHLRRGTLDPRHVRMLVLDEADEMLSMGFEREVTAILDTLPKDRQTLLFSATVPPDIERMAKKLRTPEYLTLSGDHIGALELEHFVYMVATDKLAALIRVIEVENPTGAVVFCNTKDETERVAQALQRQGYDADWLNGDLPQNDREKVMSATREGRLRFLVATDVAARGIDISHLTHVINHDFPQDAESYVHRTGRTGRAGRTGTAISLITPHDVGGLYLLRLTYKIRPIEKQIPTEGELKTRAEADLVTLLVEAFTGSSGGRAVHPDDLALARRLLTHEQSDIIFAGLLRDHLGARPTVKQEAAAARRATRPAPPPPPPRMAKAPVVQEQAPPPVLPKPAAPPKVVDAPVVHEAPRAQVAPAVAPPVAIAAPTRPAPSPVREAVSAPRPPADVAPEGGFAAKAPVEVAREGSSAPRPPADAPRPDRRPDDRGRDSRGREDRRDGRGDARGGRATPEAPPVEAPRPPRRPRREDFLPVSAATGSHEGQADPRHPPQRHSDFSTWQPAAEEGDDEPILGHEVPGAYPQASGHNGGYPQASEGSREQRPRGDRDRGRRGPSPSAQVAASPAPAFRPAQATQVTTGETPRAPAPRHPDRGPAAPPIEAAPAADDADYAEIYVNIGRRDGARAADYQGILTERAGIDRAHVRRIRVRERNAFVSVRREDLVRALAALNGATLAGRVAMAEQARERTAGEGEGPIEGAPAIVEGESAPPPAAVPPHEAAIATPGVELATAAVPPAEPSDDGVPTGRSRS